jgi:hypothetical protein
LILNMTTPSKFIPSTAADFVGHGDFGAATAARSLEALVAQSRQNKNASMAILFNGRPGIGKSALARWFLYDVLGCSKFSVTKLNGAQVNLDRVEDIAAGLPCRTSTPTARPVRCKVVSWQPIFCLLLPFQGASAKVTETRNPNGFKISCNVAKVGLPRRERTL